MGQRHEKQMYEGKAQRGPDRRQNNRRTSDTVATLIKYVAVALIAAVLAKLML